MNIEAKKLINCGNEFYPRFFSEVCEALEGGETVEVYIDCIGHTRNNVVQEIYKEKLLKKYGSAIEVQRNEGAYSNSHCYCLKAEKERED